MESLIVDSRENCLELPEKFWHDIHEKFGQKRPLEPGLYIIRIKRGGINYWSNKDRKEPFVILQIYGGLFRNLANMLDTSSTMVTLNGYNDTLTLAVKEETTLYAFFMDYPKSDNSGKVEISIIPA